MKHLYRSWDNSLYITDQFDGDNGHLLELSDRTTMNEIAYVVSSIEEVKNVACAYWGYPSNVEVLAA